MLDSEREEGSTERVEEGSAERVECYLRSVSFKQGTRVMALLLKAPLHMGI